MPAARVVTSINGTAHYDDCIGSQPEVYITSTPRKIAAPLLIKTVITIMYMTLVFFGSSSLIKY